jgi:hypothetical protein
MCEGSMDGGASDEEGCGSGSGSELFTPGFTLRADDNSALLGVFCDCCGDFRVRAGDAGEEGGEDSCVGARAKRGRFVVGGGVVLRGTSLFWGERSLFIELYGLLWAVARVERRGEYGW